MPQDFIKIAQSLKVTKPRHIDTPQGSMVLVNTLADLEVARWQWNSMVEWMAYHLWQSEGVSASEFRRLAGYDEA